MSGTLSGSNVSISGTLSGGTTISHSSTYTNTLSTATTSNSTGALIISGGIGLSNTTDATSATNGGTITTAGGVAIAKTLYVGTTINTKKTTITDVNSNLLVLNNTASTTLANILFINDVPKSFELGLRGSGAGPNPGSFYIYDNANSAFRMVMDNSNGNITFNSSAVFNPAGNLSMTTTTGSTSNSTGVVTLSGGLGISLSTDASSSTNGGTITTAGGVAIAKKLYVGSDTITTRNTISTGAGVHAFGFDATGLNNFGGGAHMHFGNSKAAFLGYNYTTSTYTDLELGSSFKMTAAGLCGIGGTGAFPLDILSTTSGSITGAYGFLASTGTGTGSGTGTTQVSLRCAGRIFATEINAYSDMRIKKDIRDIDLDEAMTFMTKVNPVHYVMRRSEEKSYGYIAQQLLKVDRQRYTDLVNCHKHDQPIDEIIDDDGFVSPKDHILTVNYVKAIPLLHKCIQHQQEQIARLEEVLRRNGLLDE